MFENIRVPSPPLGVSHEIGNFIGFPKVYRKLIYSKWQPPLTFAFFFTSTLKGGGSVVVDSL